MCWSARFVGQAAAERAEKTKCPRFRGFVPCALLFNRIDEVVPETSYLNALSSASVHGPGRSPAAVMISFTFSGVTAGALLPHEART